MTLDVIEDYNGTRRPAEFQHCSRLDYVCVYTAVVCMWCVCVCVCVGESERKREREREREREKKKSEHLKMKQTLIVKIQIEGDRVEQQLPFN